jgi:hypothetical protein
MQFKAEGNGDYSNVLSMVTKNQTTPTVKMVVYYKSETFTYNNQVVVVKIKLTNVTFKTLTILISGAFTVNEASFNPAANWVLQLLLLVQA